MGNDYQVLGLEQGASQKEIKKAYFSLVRKYSPEENPVKFREIREAYERLKNQAENQGPVFARPSDPLAAKFLDLFWKYQKAHDAEKARDVCEEAWGRFPGEIQFLYHLAVAQRRAGNTGKSVRSCEELVKREPDNKWFWRELALSYDERSYRRKAFQAYEKAYELGCRDNKFLIDFSLACDNYDQFDRGIQVLTEVVGKDRRWQREEIPEVLDAYSGLLSMHCAKADDLYDVTADFIRFVRQYSIYMAENFRMFSRLAALFCLQSDTGSQEVVKELFTVLDKVCSSEKEKEWLAQFRMEYLGSRLAEDERLTETLQYAFQAYFLMDDEVPEVQAFAVMDIKLCMIEERREILGQMEIVEKEYPVLFEKISDFAEQLKDEKNIGYIKSSLLKKYTGMAKYIGGGVYFEQYPEEKKKVMGTVFYEKDKPFVRSGKKIGRNDPCPCGSGKKYKHCCMNKANAG